MLLFLSITGIVLSIILLYFNVKKYTSSVYLGSFFLLISLYGFVQHSLFYSDSLFLVSLTYINFAFLTYLIGPALYWYVRSLLMDNARLKKADIWHLLPAAIFLLTSAPYIFSSWSFKIMNGAEILKDIGFIGYYKPTVLYRLFPNAAIYLSRPAVVLFYVFWSAGMLVKYIFSNKESSVFTGQRYMLKWLAALLGFLFILAISQFILVGESFIFENSRLFFTFNLLQIISAIGLAGLLISPFFFPAILYGLPRYPENTREESSLGESIFLANNSFRRKMPAFESNYIEIIGQKIINCMSTQQPHLSPNCNLIAISKCTGLPVHHLAYYFREIKKQTFNDFRNEWRINHAKKLILEGKARDLTLEAIGILSGFSTRNTFFTAFKKIEGVSPSTFSSRIS